MKYLFWSINQWASLHCPYDDVDNFMSSSSNRLTQNQFYSIFFITTHKYTILYFFPSCLPFMVSVLRYILISVDITEPLKKKGKARETPKSHSVLSQAMLRVHIKTLWSRRWRWKATKRNYSRLTGADISNDSLYVKVSTNNKRRFYIFLFSIFYFPFFVILRFYL